MILIRLSQISHFTIKVIEAFETAIIMPLVYSFDFSKKIGCS